jgi:hypothetical protein
MDVVTEIEKKTIIARMAVSIFKMNRAQLLELYKALENDGGTAGGRDLAARVPGGNDKLSDALLVARIFVLSRQLDKDALLNRLHAISDLNMRWVRAYPRKSCSMLVDFAAHGKAHRGYIRDISATGAHIETSADLQAGRELAMCFTISEGNDCLPFRIKGRIVRVYTDGIGVQYEHMTTYQRDIIHALITKNHL